MADLHTFETEPQLLSRWMQLVMQAQVGSSEESYAILAAQNQIVALQRKTAQHDDTHAQLRWEGEDPMWTAIAGDRIAVVVTDDDDASPFAYQAWLALENKINQPIEHCGPQGLYTLEGAKAWCADRLTGLTEELA
ncbi:hypothetical protein SE17_29470 [Kouleothrix aurantiaca]|uniref:Uncharacterized protein n=1 Tax=Kouleothrix aurantiaca TaxID=186479 RepID=A0A0P9FBN9_9CHLR|nr:hypothetical protein SE17_29470 [Kouleothrix aurantiaca]